MTHHRLLLADDDPEMRSWVRDVLRSFELEIIEAASGWEVLGLLATKGPFTLVVSDVRMPPPSGLNVVTMARSAGLETPFIIITAVPDDRLRQSIEMVPDAWVLEKPFRARDLMAIVSAVTNNHKPD